MEQEPGSRFSQDEDIGTLGSTTPQQQTTATYHDHLDSTFLIWYTAGKTTQDIVDDFNSNANFPLIASFVEARLKTLFRPSTAVIDAMTLLLWPEDVEKAFGSVSLSEAQVDMPVKWNMHVDMYVSEIDGDDEVIRDRAQEACDFVPPVTLGWLNVRLRDIAPNSLEWVLRNGRVKESLVARIRQRMVVGGVEEAGLIQKVGQMKVVSVGTEIRPEMRGEKAHNSL
ncbi:hypothetical protein MMC16_007397 [Acarospora aff. strigata]|nr:hypothetical protein [Acarospora aff. strigata]